MAPRKLEKLDALLSILYVLLEDVLLLAEGARREIRNADIRRDLEALARRVSFRWIRAAVQRADELSELVRRNIQKSIALDALVVELRASGGVTVAMHESLVQGSLPCRGSRQYGSMFLVELLESSEWPRPVSTAFRA